MAESNDSKEVVSLDELAISNIYGFGAPILLVAKKELVTKQEKLDTI